MYTNANVTIYNKHFDKATRMDKYYRTVIEGVFWDDKKATNRLQSGLENADEVLLIIPFDYNSSKKYITPVEYKKMEDVTEYFTIQEGDRIVKGDIGFEISKPTDLDREYEAFTITSVDTKDFGSSHMRHWEVGAK